MRKGGKKVESVKQTYFKNGYILPGFVNTHVHTSQQISRGVGDDVDFITWFPDEGRCYRIFCRT